MDKQFTADDVTAAAHADLVRHSVSPDTFPTVENVLRELAVGNTPEEEAQDLVNNRALFLAGMQVLKQARLSWSGRTVAPNVAYSEVPDTAISPAVLFERGYVGTMPAYEVGWLVAREQPASLRFVTPGEAAIMAGTSESGWRNKAAAGQIAGAVKKGKQWLIPITALPYHDEYWQHRTSGERFAVTVDQQGIVKRAAGPLPYSEVTAANLLGGFNTDQELVEDLNATADEYRLVEL